LILKVFYTIPQETKQCQSHNSRISAVLCLRAVLLESQQRGLGMVLG
jgi:hypothetical protein